jgi:hypothetical protein
MKVRAQAADRYGAHSGTGVCPADAEHTKPTKIQGQRRTTVGRCEQRRRFPFAARIAAAVGYVDNDASNMLLAQVANSAQGDDLAARCNTSVALLTNPRPAGCLKRCES